MNSWNSVPRTYPSHSREAVLKIRPAPYPDLDFGELRPGPGSGSLGEFIEKIDSERSDKLLGELCQGKNDTYGNYFVVFAIRRCDLLLLPGREQHIPGRYAATPAIFRIQLQIILEEIVFS